MILFIIISLVKVLPYGRFRQIHKVGAVLFLLAAFHSVYLLPDSLRWAPFGLLTLAVSVVGSLAALWSLFGQSGRMQRGDHRRYLPSTLGMSQCALFGRQAFLTRSLAGHRQHLTVFCVIWMIQNTDI